MTSLTWSLTTVPLVHFTPAAVASFLFLKLAYRFPFPKILHYIYFYPECFSSEYLQRLNYQCIEVSYQILSYQRVFIHIMKNSGPYRCSYPHYSALVFFRALITLTSYSLHSFIFELLTHHLFKCTNILYV